MCVRLLGLFFKKFIVQILEVARGGCAFPMLQKKAVWRIHSPNSCQGPVFQAGLYLLDPRH